MYKPPYICVTKPKNMNTTNLVIKAETEKAIQFEVGFKFNENAPFIIYGTEGNQTRDTGYIVSAWVPKSIIKDGEIPAWFVIKNINPLLKGFQDRKF